jgi:hypothetical protein
VDGYVTEQLNEIGAQGWELVIVTRASRAG